MKLDERNARFSASEIIQNAIARVIETQPEYGLAAACLKLVEMPGLGTCATNGRDLVFDPDFIRELTTADVENVVRHEVLHVALLHPVRIREIGSVDHRISNIAADIIVNEILERCGVKMTDLYTTFESVFGIPKDRTFDDDYHAMYLRVKRLFEDQEKNSKINTQESQDESGNSPFEMPGNNPESDPDSGDDSDGDSDDDNEGDSGKNETSDDESNSEDDSTDNGGSSDDDSESDSDNDSGAGNSEKSEDNSELSAEVKQALKDAAKDGGGVLPMPDDYDGDMETDITERMQSCTALAMAAGRGENSSVMTLKNVSKTSSDWLEEIRDYFTAKSNDKRLWIPGNLRLINHDIVWPTYGGKTLGEVFWFIDCSGSTVSDDLIQNFVENYNEVLDDFPDTENTVVFWGSGIVDVLKFNPGERVKIDSIPYGGGTQVSCVFKYLENEKKFPDLVIIMSDMIFSDLPKKRPPYDVIWLWHCAECYRNEMCIPHFGEMVKLTFKL